MSHSPRMAAFLLIAIATSLRLLWAAALPVSTDEAYHWLYTVHPDVSFFDHPPMTMFVAKAGISLCGGWVHPFSLRLGFVLLCAATSWCLFRWTARFFGDVAGVWAVLGFSVSHYLTAFGGPFALPDSPLFFFSVLTWWQASEAVFSSDPGRNLRRWLIVGVGFGGAMLSKYHGVLVPGGVVLFALLTPRFLRLLWQPGPYLAVAIGLALFSPVIWWNATHDWASFKFQGGRMGSGGSPLVHGGPLVWLVGSLLFLTPWMWFWLSLELGLSLLRFRTLPALHRLLVCLAVVPLGFFLASSFTTGKVLPHWPLLGYLPLFPLAATRWAGLRLRRPLAISWVVGEFGILAVILIQVTTGAIPLPAQVTDETRAYSGWTSVVKEIEAHGILNEPNIFLVTNRWDDSAQLSFALRNRVPVACYQSFDARGFAFWSRPEDYVGRTGFFLVLDQHDEKELISEFGSFFERMTLHTEFAMNRGGVPFRSVRLYRCENQLRPYPFDYTSRAK